MLSILRLFCPEKPSWTVVEAAEALGIAGSTTYRHFRALSDAGLIVAYAAGRYSLGPAIIEYDRQIRALDPLITAAKPVMQKLARSMQHPGVVLLCRIYRDRVMCVDQASGSTPQELVSYERGRPMPLFRGAASKIIFAHLPARRTRALYERFASEIAEVGLGRNWDELKSQLRALRGEIVAVTRGELDAGMIGLSAAVFGADGEVVASIGYALHESEAVARDFDKLRERVARAAEATTLKLAEQAEGAWEENSPAVAHT